MIGAEPVATGDPTPPGRVEIAALGAVIALGPFAIDMYLASLPAIGSEFDAPDWVTQLTLTGYLVVLGLGQLLAGPMTDALGRRVPLLAALLLFISGSALGALAPSMAVLVAARIIQGAGGAMAFVVVTSVVGDRAVGDRATRIFAALMVVAMVAPIIAPVVGGVIAKAWGWRAVFASLSVLGVVALATAFFCIGESLPQAGRVPVRFRSTMRTYRRILSVRRYLLPCAALVLGIAYLFSYLGGASYIYQGPYGLDEAQFGIIFGATGSAALVGALAAHLLASRIDTVQLALLGSTLVVAGPVLSCGAAILAAPVEALAAGMFVGLIGLGMMEPALMSLCISSVRSNLGAASAVLGAAQNALGGVAAAVVAGPLVPGPRAWTALMVLISLASAGLTVISGRSSGRQGVSGV